MGLIGKLFGGGLRAQVLQAANLVKMGLCERLVDRYKHRYHEDFAFGLAAAVTNTVFSDPPGNEEGRHFLEQNHALVEHETRALSQDQKTCYVITQMVRAKLVVPFSRDQRSAEALWGPIETLQRYSILVSGGEAPSLDTLLPLVNQFYLTRNSDASS